ncbi:hypothetical protein [Nocardia aurantia]|uniref:Uncharacterized protein n=1 Tax=Nocardia aurantia TaxID=2585199 RepID=A0A7K0DPT0_9NOCA|nr:hypothetical protein [Nocardia aurantia]MQY27770.1 hypothetical protein [Nocardia aurantia]
MTETFSVPSPITRVAAVRPLPGEGAESPSGAAALAELGCRLARQLFDAGLRLDALHAVYDRPDASREDLRAAGIAVGDILDRLGTMLHDTGKTILADAIDRMPYEPVEYEPTDPVRRSRRGL